MRLTEYGRNPQKHKASVQQPALLRVGVAVRKAKHRAGMGTQTAINCRPLAFPHTREGFRRLAQTLTDQLGHNHCRRLLLAMEPSGSYWHALYARLNSCGYGVCLGHCQAVRHNRQTRPEGTRKTDATEADSVFDVLLQGTCFLPVARDPERRAASRVMQRPMALKQRVRQRRHPLRAAIHLACPERHPLMNDLTHPTA